MSGDMNEVRSALFGELRQLRGDKPDLERAKAVREVAKVIIDSAKVEVDFLNVMGGGNQGTGFFARNDTPDPLSKPQETIESLPDARPYKPATVWQGLGKRGGDDD